MKFLALGIFSTFLATSFVNAQQVVITKPTAGQIISAGSTIPVRITRPNFQSSSEEVAVVIGFKSCAESPAFCQIDALGAILYNGLYRPKNHNNGQFYQDIKVTIPSGTPSGNALLNIVHFALIGASLIPWTQTLNQTINIG